jgi:hypothetical protein
MVDDATELDVFYSPRMVWALALVAKTATAATLRTFRDSGRRLWRRWFVSVDSRALKGGYPYFSLEGPDNATRAEVETMAKNLREVDLASYGLL